MRYCGNYLTGRVDERTKELGRRTVQKTNALLQIYTQLIPC